MKAQTRARLKLLGVFLIFVGPLALAYVLYYGLSYGAPGNNEGELVQPAVRLPEIELTSAAGEALPSGQLFERKWTFLQVAPTGCEAACIESLEETRQIRALLHRRATRVQRVLLTPAKEPAPQLAAQPDLQIYRGELNALRKTLASKGAMTAGTVYLIDPLGNWMLYYPPAGDGEGLFKDIKRLLKLSHIG